MVNSLSNAVKHASISVSEILLAGGRLEASVFNLEARQARELINACGCPTKSLTDQSLISSASYPGRFKRNYVSEKIGLPFILPSQITEINPRASKWIFGLKDSDLVVLSVNQGDLLLTRSGTIGQCSLAGKQLSKKVMSDDLIRIVPHHQFRGYLYTFIKSKVGQLLLKTSNYGAVIQHIEPSHLAEILVPVANEKIVKEINDLIIHSFNLRDESNDLISEARDIFTKQLNLPVLSSISLNEFKPGIGVINFSIPFNLLDERLEGSYHNPLVYGILSYLTNNTIAHTTISDARISKKIILPGRFKRVYVEEGFGVPFIGGKEIGSLDPRTGKNLSLQGHGERIKAQLTIHENQILITCSGTIGKVNIAPKHWDGWTSSQHIIRIEPTSAWMAGYLYAWLSTDYGRELIKRFTYGSVVDEVDEKHIGNVLVPLVEEPLMKEIGNFIIKANAKRYTAFELEQQALKIFNEKVLGISSIK